MLRRGERELEGEGVFKDRGMHAREVKCNHPDGRSATSNKAGGDFSFQPAGLGLAWSRRVPETLLVDREQTLHALGRNAGLAADAREPDVGLGFVADADGVAR